MVLYRYTHVIMFETRTILSVKIIKVRIYNGMSLIVVVSNYYIHNNIMI